MKLTTKSWSLRCTIQTRLIEAHLRRYRGWRERSIWHSFLISFIVSCLYLLLLCRGSTSISTYRQHQNGKKCTQKVKRVPRVHRNSYTLNHLYSTFWSNKSTFWSKSKLHCSAKWTVCMRSKRPMCEMSEWNTKIGFCQSNCTLELE